MSKIILAVAKYFMLRWDFTITIGSICNHETFHFIRCKQLSSKVVDFFLRPPPLHDCILVSGLSVLRNLCPHLTMFKYIEYLWLIIFVKVNILSIKNGWGEITPSPKYPKNVSGVLFIVGAQ